MVLRGKSIIVMVSVFSFVISARAQEILEASQSGDIGMVKTLIEGDSTLLNAADNAGRTAYHFAANSGYEEIVRYLLSKGVDKNLKTKANTTALHYAALNGHLDVVKLLVENGVELEIKNSQTATPLYYAAMRGHTDVVNFLIQKGAVVDALDREEGTPLHTAAQSGHLEMVRLLIENGAEKKKKDINGRTAMHFACMNGNPDIIAFLIQSGLGENDPDVYAKTPLYYAASGGNEKAVDLLWLDGKLDINQTASNGNTYLHAAAAGGLKKFAEILISKGADAAIENVYRMTPFSLAIKNSKTDVADVLIANGVVRSNENPPVLKGKYLGQKKPGAVPELFAPGIISTDELNERDVSFNREGDEFYFSSWGGQNPFNIMCMKLENNQWTEPQQASFSGRYQDAEAYFTPDEQKIFFISNRPKSGTGNPETWEIWFVEREGEDWSVPTLLGSPFEGGFYTTFTKTWKMYYTQNGDIYSSLHSNGKFEEPKRLEENVNSEEGEYNSFVAPDESYLIFTSIRTNDHYGGGDLYICFHRQDGTWTKAINMGPAVNSFTRDYCPSVSPDGKYFFFCSSRFGTEDIFWVNAKIIEDLKPF
jgi:ankyrin repeat protein